MNEGWMGVLSVLKGRLTHRDESSTLRPLDSLASPPLTVDNISVHLAY